MYVSVCVCVCLHVSVYVFKGVYVYVYVCNTYRWKKTNREQHKCHHKCFNYKSSDGDI